MSHLEHSNPSSQVPPVPEFTSVLASKRRSPRTRRQPEGLPNRLITPLALRIIFYIATYRFAVTSWLTELVGGHKRTVADHLFHLYHRGIVNRFQISRNGEFIYFTDSPDSLSLLASAGYQIPNQIHEWVRSQRQRDYAGAIKRQDPGKLLFAEHEVMVSRFHASVELACRASRGEVELLWFRQGSELYHTLKIPKVGPDGREQVGDLVVSHRPDAAFVLRTATSGDRLFFYEADRKTSSVRRFREKLRIHFHFVARLKLPEKVYGLPRVRGVLIETLDSHWAERLRMSARHPIVSGPKPSPLFWFAPSKMFAEPIDVRSGNRIRQVPRFLIEPGRLFQKMWATPTSDDLLGLLD